MKRATVLRFLFVGGITLLVLFLLSIGGGPAAAGDVAWQPADPAIGENVDIHNQVQEDNFSYMPTVYQRWPPIPLTPTLHPIGNGDGDGYYQVYWTTAYLADTYDLQEDDNAAFSSPVNRYSGTGTSMPVSNQPTGTWYYRGRACNGYGCSPWSNIQSVTVRPPLCTVYVENDTGGDLCYEVQGTGIGNKCFPPGEHLYGQFPPGTYTFCASGWCGSICDTEYYDSGDFYHAFWCEYGRQEIPATAELRIGKAYGEAIAP